MADPGDHLIGFLGAGRQSFEISEYLAPDVHVSFAAVDDRYLQSASPFRLVWIGSDDTDLLETPVNVCVGAPAVRRGLVAKWAGHRFARIVDPTSWVSRTAQLGEGVTVSPGAVVTARVRIGDHSHVNVRASLSHGVDLGRFCSISPGATIAGEVIVEDGVFVGAGAVVLGGVRLGSGSVIGAGAVVKDDTRPNGVYVGVPAREVRTREDWIDVI